MCICTDSAISLMCAVKGGGGGVSGDTSGVLVPATGIPSLTSPDVEVSYILNGPDVSTQDG